MFLHTFTPTAIITQLGPITLYWYGLLIVLGIISAIGITQYLAKQEEISKDTIYDLAFYVVLSGILGARIYDILLEIPYYLHNPLATFKVWQGGLAIHGGLLGGGLALWYFAKKNKIPFLKLSALIIPGLALGQAIGRFGNYFNQELFGKPTGLPWGIPIEFQFRPPNYLLDQYFHPTFLYESFGNLVIFGLTFCLVRQILKLTDEAQKTLKYFQVTLLYLASYSILRFSLEFVRIDAAPTLFGLRWPQLISLLIIITTISLYFNPPKATLAK